MTDSSCHTNLLNQQRNLTRTQVEAIVNSALAIVLEARGAPPFRAGLRVTELTRGRIGIIEGYNPMLPSGWIYRVTFGNHVELHRAEALAPVPD